MNISNHKYSWWLSLVLFAFLLRIGGIGEFTSYLGDEAMHVPAAKTYQLSGHANPDHYGHPPLKYLLLQGSMKIFGDNPYGWRMRNVLCGTLTVLVLLLVGRELFADDRVVFLAAFFLALDPLHILLSRSTFDEVPAALFFLTSVYFLIRSLKYGRDSLLLAGLFLGLATAMKWYYGPAILVMAAASLWYRSRDGGWSWLRAADITSALTLLPLGVYLLVSSAWFGRGYTLVDFLQMHVDAYRDLQSIQPQGLNGIFLNSGSPGSWFLRPVLFGMTLPASGTASRFIMFINDPPVWMLTFPAMGYISYRIATGKERLLVFLPLLFLAVYGQFLLIRRPILLYSAMAFFPVVLPAIAAMLLALADRLKRPAVVYAAVLAGTFAWCMYLYPLTAGRLVPESLYTPLTSRGSFLRPF